MIEELIRLALRKRDFLDGLIEGLKVGTYSNHRLSYLIKASCLHKTLSSEYEELAAKEREDTKRKIEEAQ